MQWTFVVEYGSEGSTRRKKISVTELKNLKMACADKFDIMVPFRLEQWDVTCCSEGLWIEVDDYGDLENGSRLRIAPTLSLPSVVSAKQPEENEARIIGSHGDLTQTMVPDLATADTAIIFQDADIRSPAATASTDFTDVQSLTGPSAETNIDEASLSSESSPRVPESRATKFLNVKLLSSSTRDHLASQRKLDFRGLSDIYQGVYDTFKSTNSTSYPDNYRDMAHGLLTAYPQLADSLGIPEEKALATLAMKLRNKFKNKRRLSVSPPVVERKLAKSGKSPCEIRVKGLKYYHPKSTITLLEAEKMRNQIIAIESGNGEERKTLLKETLSERRKAIIDDKKSIRKLKDLFPFIFGSDEIWAEMSLLVGEPVKERYHNAMETWLKKVADATGCTEGDAASTLLRLLEEEDQIVLEELKPRRAAPYILDEQPTLVIIVECIRVAECSSLKDALLLLAIAIYVFNQKPATAMRSFAWFMCEKVLQVPHETTATQKAMSNLRTML